MAGMNTTRLRDNLFSRLFAGVSLNPADETKVKDSLLIWAEEIIAEVQRAEIDLTAGDIPVPGAGLETDELTPVPITGTTSNDDVVLAGVIK